MSEQGPGAHGPDPIAEPSIVWWPWGVLAIGPALAVVLAAVDGDPGGGVVAFVIVGALAVLFLGIVFAPALLLISRNTGAPPAVRGRAAFVFVSSVVAAHVVGQLIDRLGPDDGGSSLWGLAFIGTYVAASVGAWRAMGRAYAEADAGDH